MIDHLTLPVSNYEKSKEFFSRVLEPLGYQVLQDVPKEKLVGFGTEDKLGKQYLWVRQDADAVRGSKYCIAFKAPSKQAVNDFYQASLQAGAEDNGAPGYRPKYHPAYYSAFVFDSDGYNIEAVFADV